MNRDTDTNIQGKLFDLQVMLKLQGFRERTINKNLFSMSPVSYNPSPLSLKKKMFKHANLLKFAMITITLKVFRGKVEKYNKRQF